MEQPPWWTYSILSLLFFIGLIILNLIVNKINAARIDERFANMAKQGNKYPEPPVSTVPVKKIASERETKPTESRQSHPDPSPPEPTGPDQTVYRTVDYSSSMLNKISEHRQSDLYETIDGAIVEVIPANIEPRGISLIGRSEATDQNETENDEASVSQANAE